MRCATLYPKILAISTIAVCVFLGMAIVAWWVWSNSDSQILHDPLNARATTSAAGVEAEGDPTASDGGAIVVALPDGKLDAAQIKVESVRNGPFIYKHTVPGRVTYNENRHVEIKTPSPGVLLEVLVKPGDRVNVGQMLAQLNSPEVGTARADVLKRQAESEFARQLLERATRIEENVFALVGAVKQRIDFDSLKTQFAGRVLGDYRERVFGTYSRLLLAESLDQTSELLAESGALARKTLRERESDSQSALAALQAACEQAELNVWKERSHEENAAGDAARRLQIARQRLAALLLSPSAIKVDGQPPGPLEMGPDDDNLEQLSLVAVRAPFSGTIEARKFAVGERIDAGDSLFVLADTQSLWIQAEIRESNWAALGIETGQTVECTAPALGDRKLSAKVYFVGREVSQQTNAIPIVAEIDNIEGLLRPGLFVRVTVPIAATLGVLTVPAHAVLRHEGKVFVFVRDAANQFRRCDVEIGLQGDDRVQIVSGLTAGQSVVSHGAFFLKSELLLESEEE